MTPYDKRTVEACAEIIERCARDTAYTNILPLADLFRALPTSEPEGWRLVPVEPSEAMIEAAFKRRRDQIQNRWKRGMVFEPADDYRAMLAAAPPPAPKEGA